MAKKKLPKKSTKKAAKPSKRPARPAARKAKARAKAPAKAKAKAVRKPARRVTKPAAKKAARKVVKKVAREAARKPVRKVVAKPARKASPPPPVRLQRERRRLPEVEAEGFTGTGGGDSRLLSSAKAGHDEMRSELRQHTESSPELTAGDLDAKWQDAYAVGDEAPGGDNMTPDQDRVDDIGKALGIEYDDDEELQGGAELTARDDSRWELDPDSKEEDEDE